MGVASPAVPSPYLFLPERARCLLRHKTPYASCSWGAYDNKRAGRPRESHQEGDGCPPPQWAARPSKAVCHGMPGHASPAWYVPSEHLVTQYIESDLILLGFDHRNQHRKRAIPSGPLNGSFTPRTSSRLLHWRKVILLTASLEHGLSSPPSAIAANARSLGRRS